METYTKEQLKELGFLFYEDCTPVLKEFVVSSKFYTIDKANITEDIFYSEEYDNFIRACYALERCEGKEGPIDIDLTNFIGFITL